MKFFGLRFFHESTTHRPLMNTCKYFRILFFDLPEIFMKKRKLSANYTVERHAFQLDNPWKVKTFRELNLRMFALFKEHLSQISTKLEQLSAG
jgi:hypothetical protein